MKGVMQYGKRGKLSFRFISKFKILDNMGPVANKPMFPQHLLGFYLALYLINTTGITITSLIGTQFYLIRTSLMKRT